MMKKIETERLLLKPASLEDAVFFLNLYNSPKFIKYIGDKNLRTITDTENYIKEKFLPSFEKNGFGNYVVILKSNKEKIGAVGIFTRNELEVHDIGFSFPEQFEGNGYAYEAASKLKELAFTDFGLKKLSAITTKDNFSSQKLIEKLELIFQKFIRLSNGDDELLYYESI